MVTVAVLAAQNQSLSVTRQRSSNETKMTMNVAANPSHSSADYLDWECPFFVSSNLFSRYAPYSLIYVLADHLRS